MEIYAGSEIAAYGFPHGHPFSLLRHGAFLEALERDENLKKLPRNSPVMASNDILKLFHEQSYIDFVRQKSSQGTGYLDAGDTPAFAGVYEAAAFVVGSAVDAVDRIMDGKTQKAFIPIAGLHHARRDKASGFCVFNDCGVVIEYLINHFSLTKVAYVDIDAHHGDGVYYGFEQNPKLIFADIHESGRYLFPGTGFAGEKGKGEASGLKLNIELEPGSADELFFNEWSRVMQFLKDNAPEFILLQCGADSLAGDPLTHLEYSPKVHQKVAADLATLANLFCGGKMLAVGGGGYNLTNLQNAWTGVVQSMASTWHELRYFAL